MNTLNQSLLIIASAICLPSCSLIPRESQGITENSHLVTVDGVEIACDVYEREAAESGAPQDIPIVLLHGLGATNYTWNNNIAPLSKHFKLIAIDYMGLSDTKRNLNNGYSLDNLTNVTLNAMDELGIDKATIIGNSLGGGIALVIAIKHPERVEKLVLIAPASYPQELPSRFKLAQIPILPEIFLNLLPPEWMIGPAVKEVYHDPSKITKERKYRYADPMRSWATQQAVLKTIRELPPKNTDELVARYGEINKKTLIIWGENDRIVPPRFAKRLAKDIKGARLLVIPECGHVSHEEKPEIVNQALLDFLVKREEGE